MAGRTKFLETKDPHLPFLQEPTMNALHAHQAKERLPCILYFLNRDPGFHVHHKEKTCKVKLLCVKLPINQAIVYQRCVSVVCLPPSGVAEKSHKRSPYFNPNIILCSGGNSLIKNNHKQNSTAVMEAAKVQLLFLRF